MRQALLSNEYPRIVDGIRRAVEEVVPPGSTVLVVSKGDPELLAFSQRTGWHFPRSIDGQYAGFHPADSGDAIARLDFQRGLGARYFAIPSTGAWWLTQYPEFVSHVRTNGRLLFEDESVGWIFELRPKAASAPLPTPPTEGPSLETKQLVTLLEAVLPATATVAILASRNNDVIPHSPLPTFAFRYTDDPLLDVETAIDDLHGLAAGVAEFLVVPVSARDWLGGQPTLAAHIDERYALVTDQRNVCKIYDLRLRPGELR